MPTNTEILTTLFQLMPEDERAVLCTVGGDPNKAEQWPGIAWRQGSKCPLHANANNYAAVSGFYANEHGSYRRRKDQFAGLYALMVDDIGTKVDKHKIPDDVVPTMVVETSPGNYQAVFRLREPVRDYVMADALIRALTSAVTGGGPDPGMMGVTRVFRLPEGINGKPKYMQDGNPWRCRIIYWDPTVVVDPEWLATRFHAVLRIKSFVEPDTEVTAERKRGFDIVMQGLRTLDRVRSRGRGWVDILCPWVADHTDRGETGTAVAMPDKSNGYMGGFRCHHGHCEGRGWGDLEDWVAERLLAHGRATRGPFLGAPTDGDDQ